MPDTNFQYRKRSTLLKSSGHFIRLPVCFVLLCSFSFLSRAHSLSYDAPTEIYSIDRVWLGTVLEFPAFKVSELLACYAQDQNLVAGIKALQDGQQLAAQNTRGAHFKAIAKYEEAAKHFRASGFTPGEAGALLLIVASYIFLEQGQKALEHAKRVLTLTETGGDSAFIAVALTTLGMVHSFVNEQQKALEYFNRALPLAQDDSTVLAPTLVGMGGAYAALGKRKKAAEYFVRALKLFKSIDNKQGEVTTLTAVAVIYSKLGEQQKALELYNQALPLIKETRNFREEVITLAGIGNIYRESGDKPTALNYYEQALAVAESTGDSSGRAATLDNIGITYNDMGYKEKALDFFKQSLHLSQSGAGYKGGATRSLHNIGAVHASMNEYQKALDFYFKVLENARADVDLDGMANILVSIGAVYLRVGDHRKALEYFVQSLPLFQSLDDRKNVANTLDLIGVAISCCDKQKALDFHSRALTLGRELRNPSVQFLALSHIASIHLALGEGQKALDFYNRALTLVRESRSRDHEASILNDIGNLYLQSKDYRKAREYYERALSIEREVRDRNGEATTLTNIGAIYEEQGDLEKALDYFQKAIDIQEKVRTEARLEEFKIKLADKSLNIYTHAILVNMRLGRSTQAFDLSERARARTFLDQLGNTRVDTRKGASEQLIQKEQALRFELGSLERQFSQERAKAKEPSSNEVIATLENRLVFKRVEYETFLTTLKLKTPEYASIFSVDSLKLSEVQRRLDKETTLLSYFVTQNNTLAFVITRDSFQAKLLPITAGEISAQTVSFRSFADLRDPYPQPLRKLYGLLLSPLEPYIKTRRIGIIPHNTLHYLPFSALLNGQRYFGEDHVIFYLPSASVLSFIQQNIQPTGNNLLALAQGQAEGLPLLQYADKSAEDVARLYNTLALTDNAATETVFRARAPNSNVVFIAAHGKLNTLTPLFSKIVLAPDKSNDGVLEVHEVYGLDLKSVSLVVLSACQTQLGEHSQGDDIVGLNRAFIYAGTPTVVASLWSVQEKETGELMVAFFKQLRGGMSKAEALQAAQREMRAKYPHPYYWAAFVLTGVP